MIVSFIVSKTNLTNLHDYYCIRCRSMMFKINRDILVLWMGENYPAMQIPADMAWHEYKCRSCQTKYSVYYQ